MRAFVALDLDQGLLDAALRIRGKLERSPPKTARFTPVEKMHVTLKFLGSIDPSQAETIGAALAPLATKAPALAFDAMDAFPSQKHATVVVIHIADDGTLAALASAIEEHAEAIGIEREARPFRAHLTIARLREKTDVRAWLPKIEPANGIGTALTLYETQGSAYVPLTSTKFP